MVINTLIKKIKMIGSLRNIIIFSILFIVVECIFSFSLLPHFATITGGERIIDMKIFYSYEEVYSTINAYGQDGINYYEKIQLLDLIFPLTYAFAFSSVIARLFNRVNEVSEKAQLVILIPFITALLDYIENLGIFIMLRLHPHRYFIVALITNIITVLKFTGFVAFIFIIIFLFFFSLKSRSKKVRDK